MAEYTDCLDQSCSRRATKRGYCDSHYRQWARTGATRPLRQRLENCLVCGCATVYGFRRFCGEACRVHWETYSGKPPTEAKCNVCGASISLGELREGRRRRRADTLLCDVCKGGARSRNYRLAVLLLAERDGTECAFCGEDIDISIRGTAKDAPSIDHRIPISLGGLNDPSNLRLAHYGCNAKRMIQ